MTIQVVDNSTTSFGVRIGDNMYWVERPAYNYLNQINDSDYQANYAPQDDTEPDWAPWHGEGSEFPDVTSPDEPDYPEAD